MKPLIVTVERGLITNDALHELQNTIHRNRVDCGLPIAVLTRQTLDIVTERLRDCHVFVAKFRDGSVVYFLGRLPPGVTVEAAVKRLEGKYP